MDVLLHSLRVSIKRIQIKKYIYADTGTWTSVVHSEQYCYHINWLGYACYM